ncbi:MAG: hypothetical protein NBV68_05755 [Erythrobacter sp.]|nr:hypothetical protein [Erythrobacter sp.]
MKFMKSFANKMIAQPGQSRCEAMLREKENVAAGGGFMAARAQSPGARTPEGRRSNSVASDVKQCLITPLF